MADRNSNKRVKITAVVKIRSKHHLCTNSHKQFLHVCFFFILNFHQHLMYSLDLKTVDKVVYRREHCSVQVTLGHDDLAKIRFQLQDRYSIGAKISRTTCVFKIVFKRIKETQKVILCCSRSDSVDEQSNLFFGKYPLC